MGKLAIVWLVIEYGWRYKWFIIGGLALILIWYALIRESKKIEIADEAKKQGGFNRLSGSSDISIKNGDSSDLAGIIEETVLIKTIDGHGSGFVVGSNQGWLIITNHHVVSDHEYVKITHHDGKSEYGCVVRQDKITDLALISFPNKHGRKGAKIASISPHVGDEVFAIGSPLSESYSNSVSKGIISSINRIINNKKYIQSDVTINPGNSGGPLALKTSEVVGIAVSGMLTSEGASLGVNHFIPVEELKKSLNLTL